jgi:hemerythrin-like domain-containing protein
MPSAAPTLQRPALRILLDEHLALAAVLKGMQALLRQSRQGGRPPDLEALRAMLFYLDEFAEQQHHRKESELLFPKIRARCLEARDLLDHLGAEHDEGVFAIHRLEHALLAFEVMGEPRREAFETAVQRYSDFYLHHMRQEEQQVLPLAMSVLRPEDWDELDAAFALQTDPLLARERHGAYQDLYRRIADHVRLPALAGVG